MKHKCYRCGVKTEDWERVDGRYNCWPCGKLIREEHEAELKRLAKERKHIKVR